MAFIKWNVMRWYHLRSKRYYILDRWSICHLVSVFEWFWISNFLENFFGHFYCTLMFPSYILWFIYWEHDGANILVKESFFPHVFVILFCSTPHMKWRGGTQGISSLIFLLIIWKDEIRGKNNDTHRAMYSINSHHIKDCKKECSYYHNWGK